jgi:hypothetical protein
MKRTCCTSKEYVSYFEVCQYQSINGGVQLGVRSVLVIIRVGLNNGLLHVSAIHGETDLFYLFIFYFYFRYRKVE